MSNRISFNGVPVDVLKAPASGSKTAFTFEQGITGSLTKLSDGTSYLIAGSNVTITSASNGGITIASTAGGGGGTPGGSDTQVQFNQNSAFAGNANLTFDPTGSNSGTGALTLSGSLYMPVSASIVTENIEAAFDAGATNSFGLYPALITITTGSFIAGWGKGTDFSVAGRGVFNQGFSGAGTQLFAYGAGNFAQGFVSGTNSKIRTAATYQKGNFAQGFADGASQISCDNNGAFSQGYSTAGSYIEGKQNGSFAQGHATNGNIQANGIGGFAQGFAGGSTTKAGKGGFAQGYNVSGGEIGYASAYSAGNQKGTFAQGYVAGPASSRIVVASDGGFAQGYVSGTSDIIVKTGSNGSFAQGWAANGAQIATAGSGAFAQGFASGTTALILAEGNGAFAHGYAENNIIRARALEAWQIGVGTNDQQHSIQIEEVASGSGIRIGSRIPASVFAGDLFHDNSNSRLAFGSNVNASGSIRAELGLSGSLTKLHTGVSYLVAGSNVTITSASNGQVTVASTGGGGGTPGGADTQVQFNQNSAFAGSANLTFNPTGSSDAIGLLQVSGTQRITGTLEQRPAAPVEFGTWKQFMTGTTISAAAQIGTFGAVSLLTSASVYLMRADVVGRQLHGSSVDRGTFQITCQAYRSGANAAIGAAGVQTDFMDRSTGSFGAQFVPSGANVLLAVTGSSLDTTLWTANIRYLALTE